jgi:hypothetical protein
MLIGVLGTFALLSSVWSCDLNLLFLSLFSYKDTIFCKERQNRTFIFCFESEK